jgi:predicted nucleic acid-binding protein
MIEPFVFDTSIYIRALRAGENGILEERNVPGSRFSSPIWLSAVVLEELFAGASDKKTIKLLSKFENGFSQNNRIIVPSRSDWSNAGRILNKIGKKYGFEKIGKARLANDAVLAMSVARKGFKLKTANTKDFQLLAEFRQFRWEIE